MAQLTIKEKSSFKFWFDDYVKTEEHFKLLVRELYVDHGYSYGNIKSIVRHNYREMDTIEVIEILKEFDVKRCSQGENCKSPDGCFQILDNFSDNKNSNDGKSNQCVYCHRFNINFKIANQTKQKHMLEFQKIKELDKQDEFLIEIYKSEDHYNYNDLSTISLKYNMDDIISLLEKYDIKKCSRGKNCKSPDGCFQILDNFSDNKNLNDGKQNICKYCANFNINFKIANQTKQKHMLEFQEIKELDKQDKFLVELYKNEEYDYRDLATISLRHIDEIISLLKKHDIKRCSGEDCKSLDGCVQSLDNFVNNKNSIDGKSSHCIYCQQFYDNQPGKYDTYASQLEIYEEVRRDPNNPDLIQVKCKYSGCNKWFNPTNRQMRMRIRAINGKVQSVGAENHLYCSESCKEKCPLYNLQSDPNSSNNKSSNNERMQTELRNYFLKIRQPDHCDICDKEANQEDLILHHIIPVADNNMLEADDYNIMFVCQDCHDKAHQKDGCTTGQLAQYSMENKLC